MAGVLGEPVVQDDRDRIPVIVHTSGDRTFGLIVDRILDIVEQELVIERDHARPGTAGTAVIQGHVTDLLDVDAIVADFAPAPRHSKPFVRAA